MEVTLHTNQVRIPSGMREDLFNRISKSFGRLTDSVTRLHVSLRDVNGPRGGRDKLCTLRIDLQGGGRLFVMDQSRRMARAITRSLKKARRLTAARQLRRRIVGRKRGRGQQLNEIA